MSFCQICNSDNLKRIFKQSSPCVTSIKTLLETEMQVYHCNSCNHVQVKNSIDLADFYDKSYDISLDSDNFDQLHKDSSGEYIERTKLQAKVLSSNILETKNLKVLEFGSGKATTLRHLTKICNVDPYVFDISDSYKKYWDKWVPRANQSTYKLPEIWENKFDIICLHYVLEHVSNPVNILKDLSRFLNKTGVIYFCVPDFFQNLGDLYVVDHINKFTSESIDELATASNYKIQKKSESELDNAWLCIFKPKKENHRNSHVTKDSILNTRIYLERNKSILNEIEKKHYGDKFAIFGAGFYGTLLASLKEKKVVCFLDNNIHLQDKNLLGKPVYSPDSCPDEVDTVVFAVNPSKQKEILEDNISKFSPNKKLIGMLKES